jgi:hypothetical protein
VNINFDAFTNGTQIGQSVTRTINSEFNQDVPFKGTILITTPVVITALSSDGSINTSFIATPCAGSSSGNTIQVNFDVTSATSGTFTGSSCVTTDVVNVELDITNPTPFFPFTKFEILDNNFVILVQALPQSNLILRGQFAMDTSRPQPYLIRVSDGSSVGAFAVTNFVNTTYAVNAVISGVIISPTPTIFRPIGQPSGSIGVGNLTKREIKSTTAIITPNTITRVKSLVPSTTVIRLGFK